MKSTSSLALLAIVCPLSIVLPLGARGKTGKTGKTAPPSKNLAIPPDASPAKRKYLEDAIELLEKAMKSETDVGNQLKTAIRRLTSAESKMPRSPLPKYYLGIAYQLDKNYRRAQRTLERAVKQNPQFYEALVELADTHVWLKDYEKSIPLYDRALALRPDYDVGLERKALALMRLGRFKDALESMQKAIEVRETKDRKRLAVMIKQQIDGPGWSTAYTSESENYVVSTSISQAMADEMSRNAELILRVYEKIFTDIKRPDRKFAIWVHADKNAYVRAGNPPMAGGHYEPLVRKLVLFQHAKPADTVMVLNHEAFHQFLHDYLDQAPQWFNEGLGDYFGAFKYERRGREERMVSRPNWWRLPLIQQAIRYGRYAPISELMVMSQREMYNPQMAGIHYAQAWSLIHFSLEGGNRLYDKTLKNYFKALRKGYDREKSFKSTFGRIDMERFERQWRSHVNGLKQR